MWAFLKSLFGGVARGLTWAARMSLGLACDLVEAPFLALWRHWCPPQPEAEESTADVLRQVAGLIAEQSQVADRRAEGERPAPRPASAGAVRRSMEQALRYTTAVLHGEPLPSLAHVQPALCHALRNLTRTDAEAMHRELKGALDLDGPGWWDGPDREVLAPAPEHESAPRLRYA